MNNTDTRGKIILAGDKGNLHSYPYFFMDIDGCEYSFNVDWIPVDQYEWFVDIISRMFLDIRKRATEVEEDRFKNIFSEFVDKFK